MKSGEVGERLNPAVLKTVRPERVSGVRIPPSPPRSHRPSFPTAPLRSPCFECYCVGLSRAYLCRTGCSFFNFVGDLMRYHLPSIA